MDGRDGGGEEALAQEALEARCVALAHAVASSRIYSGQWRSLCVSQARSGT